jgi:predicted O-methyltransferase YrrM
MFNEEWYTNEQATNLANTATSVSTLSGSIIEIGCWEGKSASFLARACYPEKLICNDTWLGNIEETKITGVLHTTEQILRERDVYGAFIRNMNTLTNGNYTIVKQDCLEWLKTYNEPVKFCHIDASHEFYSVDATIKYLLPLMVEGGILCGDDFLSANMSRTDLHGGVERAVRENLPGFTSIGNLWIWKKTTTPS